jgi:hypothetical protein
MAKVDAGRDMQYRQMAGESTGAAGTSTGTAATTMTDTGATWGTTQYVGHWVVCGNRYGVILSHTGTVLTIDIFEKQTKRRQAILDDATMKG